MTDPGSKPPSDGADGLLPGCPCAQSLLPPPEEFMLPVSSVTDGDGAAVSAGTGTSVPGSAQADAGLHDGALRNDRRPDEPAGAGSPPAAVPAAVAGDVSDPGGQVDAAATGAEVTLHAAFDRLMPFHVLVGPDGTIERCGPTLDRLAGPGRLQGRAFLSAFDLRRPRDAFTFAALHRSGGSPLRLVLREGIHPPMRGLMVPLPDGRTLVNLSFGIAMVEAVGRYRLTADDFAATDLAVEMLYLVEAQSAALHESRKLNGRLQGAKIAAEEQAFTDTLTGLKNRRAMAHVMERLLTAGTGFALMLLDLDFFKDVNDTLGHAAGDHVLQTVARILLDEARTGDTVVRLGGDEFALIAPGLRDAASALMLARRIVQRIEVPIPVGNERCRVSASIGIALSAGQPGVGITDLLTRADAMLYAVKGAGRGDARVAPHDSTVPDTLPGPPTLPADAAQARDPAAGARADAAVPSIGGRKDLSADPDAATPADRRSA